MKSTGFSISLTQASPRNFSSPVLLLWWVGHFVDKPVGSYSVVREEVVLRNVSLCCEKREKTWPWVCLSPHLEFKMGEETGFPFHCGSLLPSRFSHGMAQVGGERISVPVGSAATFDLLNSARCMCHGTDAGLGQASSSPAWY